MKTINRLLLLLVVAILCGSVAYADEKPIKYINAKDLRIINRGWTNTIRDYDRLPAFLKDSVRDVLWERSQCSAGIAVRFATNSTSSVGTFNDVTISPLYDQPSNVYPSFSNTGNEITLL